VAERITGAAPVTLPLESGRIAASGAGHWDAALRPTTGTATDLTG